MRYCSRFRVAVTVLLGGTLLGYVTAAAEPRLSEREAATVLKAMLRPDNEVAQQEAKGIHMHSLRHLPDLAATLVSRLIRDALTQEEHPAYPDVYARVMLRFRAFGALKHLRRFVKKGNKPVTHAEVAALKWLAYLGGTEPEIAQLCKNRCIAVLEPAAIEKAAAAEPGYEVPVWDLVAILWAVGADVELRKLDTRACLRIQDYEAHWPRGGIQTLEENEVEESVKANKQWCRDGDIRDAARTIDAFSGLPGQVSREAERKRLLQLAQIVIGATEIEHEMVLEWASAAFVKYSTRETAAEAMRAALDAYLLELQKRERRITVYAYELILRDGGELTEEEKRAYIQACDLLERMGSLDTHIIRKRQRFRTELQNQE